MGNGTNTTVFAPSNATLTSLSNDIVINMPFLTHELLDTSTTAVSTRRPKSSLYKLPVPLNETKLPDVLQKEVEDLELLVDAGDLTEKVYIFDVATYDSQLTWVVRAITSTCTKYLSRILLETDTTSADSPPPWPPTQQQ